MAKKLELLCCDAYCEINDTSKGILAGWLAAAAKSPDPDGEFRPLVFAESGFPDGTVMTNGDRSAVDGFDGI